MNQFFKSMPGFFRIPDSTDFRLLPVYPDSDLVFGTPSSRKSPIRAKVVGVVRNNFILVKESGSEFEDLLKEEQDSVSCRFSYRGYEFTFSSRVRQIFPDKVVYIDYPGRFEIKSLRESQRINVSMSAGVFLGSGRNMAVGVIRDISEAGCRLNLAGHVEREPGTPLQVNSILPNDTAIRNVQCLVCHAGYREAAADTEIGVSFIGPPGELEKIKHFCDSVISKIGSKFPKVLLIDCDRVFTRYFSERLRMDGYMTSVSENGEDGLQCVDREGFDVVVTELALPGISGLEVLKKLKTRLSNPPEVLILTGFASIESGLDSLQQGAFDYLTKPIDTRELARRIGEACDRRRLRSTIVSQAN